MFSVLTVGVSVIVHIYQNTWNCAHNQGDFTVCKLYLNEPEVKKIQECILVFYVEGELHEIFVWDACVFWIAGRKCFLSHKLELRKKKQVIV